MQRNVEEFSRAYQCALPSVWQFVSSRIPGYQEAQDVTSEVFTRAWQSWSRYDPARGSETAWLCGIAQRTIADWWRHHHPERIEWEKVDSGEDAVLSLDELFSDDPTREPEQATLQKEFVAEMRRALRDLSARERDAVALRFGAGLQAGEIAAILDLSVGATKMMLHRAILKLREMVSTPPEASTLKQAALLDDAITDVLARRRTSITDSLLDRMLQCLAVIHRPPLPPELPSRIMACVECGSIQDAQVTRGGNGRSLFARLGRVEVATLRAATIPSCILCGAAPLIVPPLTALGLLDPAWTLHEALVFLAPFNLYILWRSYRVHRDKRGLVLATVGVALILIHLSTHALNIGNSDEITLIDFILVAMTIWVGSVLLLIGSIIDARAKRKFKIQMRAAFAT